jgi:C-terminal processing protease CtpA/Prc
MKKIRKLLIVCLFTGLTSSALAAESAGDDAPPTFSVEQIQGDFDFLYQGLKSANFDLYAFTPPGKFENHYKEYRKKFTKPMTRFDAEMAFQPFVALAHQAHTRVESDYSGYFAYRQAGGAGFPLGISVENNQLIVTTNSSGISEIKPGDRIAAINGHKVSGLLPCLIEHISAETTEFAYVLLETYMPLVVWLELGSTDAYTVSIRHKGGTSENYKISTPSEEETTGQQPFSLAGRDARMLTANIAYLRPGPFHNTEAGADSMDTTAFVQFIDTSFGTFIENGATRLILDLRDNPGGDNSFSDPVIAWFADRPFRFSANFRVRVSPQSTAANQARLEANPDNTESTSYLYAKLYESSENGEIVLFTIPETKPRPGQEFEGEVFVLVNRYSFSNAVSAAALIQDYDFGVIMGEQTVDMATTYGAMEKFTLPETGIVVTYPKALIVRSNGDDKVGPIIPDVTLPAPRIRGANDVMLQAALKHLESKAPD